MPKLMTYGDAIPFVITTPARQSVEENRKLIRSHVMRGKNRKKLPSRPRSWINVGKFDGIVRREEEKQLSIPAKVGGEFSFTAFSDEIDSDMLETIWSFQHTIFPPELALGSTQTEPSWCEPIGNDVACLHFTIFITKTYLDFIHGQMKNWETAQGHLVKTLAILQQRLASSDDELATSDSTILTVIGLTMAAIFHGDTKTALNHLRGLHKMVTLRGGTSAFERNRRLLIKILRADLVVALSTGNETLFFSDCVLWHSYIASQGELPISRAQDPDPGIQLSASDLGCFVDTLDVRLRYVWNDLSKFVQTANIVTQCKFSVDKELYQELMLSMHYRLVTLRFDTGDVNETIRLALLAFSSILFLRWYGIKTRYEYLAQRLRCVLSMTRHSLITMPAQLVLWLYIIGSTSVFDENERVYFQPALAEVLQDMKLKSWDEVRLSLKSVLWVSVLYDIPAKEVVEDTLLKPSVSSS